MQIEDIHDLAQYWSSCIDRLGIDDDKRVAYDIVSSFGGSKLWYEYYETDSPDWDVVAVFDAATDLELPNHIRIGTDENRKQLWNKVKDHVQSLVKKYSTTGDSHEEFYS